MTLAYILKTGRQLRAVRLLALLVVGGVCWAPTVTAAPAGRGARLVKLRSVRAGVSSEVAHAARIAPRAVRSWKGLSLEPTASLETVGPIAKLRADGRLVVAERLATPTTCADLIVWNPLTRHSIVPVSHLACPSDPNDPLSPSQWSQGFDDLALGSRLLTWISDEDDGYDNATIRFESASISRLKTIADPAGEYNWSPSGSTYSVDASGGTTVFSVQGICNNADPSDGAPRVCWNRFNQVYRTTVWLRVGWHWRWVWGANAWARVVGIDEGRIAVQWSGGLLILTPAGSFLQNVSIPRGRGVQVRLTGHHVIALAGRTLRVYSTDGSELAIWRLPATRLPALEDARGDLAVYTDGPRVHLVDFLDGRHAMIRTPGILPVHAQLEAPGLMYSYSRADAPQGQLEFVTSAALRSLLGDRGGLGGLAHSTGR